MWEQGKELSPPVFKLINEKLYKLDGHHRFYVAVACGAKSIPFFCQDKLNFDGIRQIERTF